MRILSACVKRFVRSTEDGANVQTNKYINSSLYSIRLCMAYQKILVDRLYLFVRTQMVSDPSGRTTLQVNQQR